MVDTILLQCSSETLIQESTFLNGALKNLFAVFLVILGFGLNRVYEVFIVRRKKRNATKDLILETHLLKEPIKNQRESIDKLLVHLKELEKNTSPEFSMPALLQIERTKHFDRTSITEFLQKHFKNRQKGIEIANKIFAGFGVIQTEFLALEKSFNEYKERGGVVFDAWHDAMDQLKLLYSEYQAIDLRNKINPETDPLFMAFNPFFAMLSQDKERDFFKVNNYFNFEITKVLATQMLDPRSSNLRYYIYICNKNFREFKEIRREMVFRFEHHSETLKVHLEKLELLVSEIKIK